MDISVKIDQTSQQFCITSGYSVSFFGFNDVYCVALELARRLNAVGHMVAEPHRDELGTLTQYEQYQKLFSAYRELDDQDTWFDSRTPLAVQQVLSQCQLNSVRVRIFYGCPLTGQDWMEEYDMCGTIGQGTGPMKNCVMHTFEGAANIVVLSQFIVRIVDLTSGLNLYRHPSYFVPALTIGDAPIYDVMAGYTHSVARNTEGTFEFVRSFKSRLAAEQWVAYMTGQSHSALPLPAM